MAERHALGFYLTLLGAAVTATALWLGYAPSEWAGAFLISAGLTLLYPASLVVLAASAATLLGMLLDPALLSGRTALTWLATNLLVLASALSGAAAAHWRASSNLSSIGRFLRLVAYAVGLKLKRT